MIHVNTIEECIDLFKAGKNIIELDLDDELNHNSLIIYQPIKMKMMIYYAFMQFVTLRESG